MIFGIDEETVDHQLGSAVVADIDPTHPGIELRADKYFFIAKGQRIPGEVPRRRDSSGGMRTCCARSRTRGTIAGSDLSGRRRTQGMGYDMPPMTSYYLGVR